MRQLVLIDGRSAPESIRLEADGEILLGRAREADLRIFDEREKSMTYLCEQPVLLEQRAFALGRTIYFFVED